MASEKVEGWDRRTCRSHEAMNSRRRPGVMRALSAIAAARSATLSSAPTASSWKNSRRRRFTTVMTPWLSPMHSPWDMLSRAVLNMVR